MSLRSIGLAGAAGAAAGVAAGLFVTSGGVERVLAVGCMTAMAFAAAATLWTASPEWARSWVGRIISLATTAIALSAILFVWIALIDPDGSTYQRVRIASLGTLLALPFALAGSRQVNIGLDQLEKTGAMRLRSIGIQSVGGLAVALVMGVWIVGFYAAGTWLNQS